MENVKGGNSVAYEIPASEVAAAKRRRRVLLISLVSAGLLMLVLALALQAMGHHGASVVSVLAAFSTGIVGLNTVAYEYPVTGATAPTAPVMSKHQQMSAIVTGDAAATTFTITHNFGIPAAQLTNGFPEVEFEAILAAGITAAPFVASKTANTVVCTCTAFTGAGLRVRVKRPFSPTL